MKFDIYKLSDGSRNRVIINKTLRKNLIKNIENLKKQKIKLKEICNKLGISYQTFWFYIKRKSSISLEFFKNLKEIYGLDLTCYMKYLESGPNRNSIRIVKNLDNNLAKILGAHVADGSLRLRKTTWGKNKKASHYELVLREEFLSNMTSFIRWFNKLFGLSIAPKHRFNHYEFYISNKLVFDYFTRIFDIPAGRKTEIIYVPVIIRNSNNNIKKAFLQGLFMFDGGVDYRTGYIDLLSKSKKLIIQTQDLFDDLGLKPDYITLKPDSFGRYKLRIRKFSKLKESLFLFEENTEKWWRLKEHLYGFGGLKYLNTKENTNKLLSHLDKFYPRKRVSSITFSDVVRAVDTLGKSNLKNISNYLARKNTVTYEYLNKLARWKILSSKREGLNNQWLLNSKFPDIRRYNMYGR